MFLEETPSRQRDIRQSLAAIEAAPWGAKTTVKKALAGYLGVSLATLERMMFRINGRRRAKHGNAGEKRQKAAAGKRA